MRNSRCFGFLAALLLFAGCDEPAEKPAVPNATVVTVIGAIHGQHNTSQRYSLDVLEQAVKIFEPDIVLVELPPDRFETASDNFLEHGEVRESRADDFPELTDVVFPLRNELGFTMIPVAAWSREIADQRRAKETELQNDPERTQDWAAYQTAIATFNKAIDGRSDDPEFIHSGAYDDLVRARQEAYEELFGDDLGAGGWAAINASHIALMNDALDKYSAQEKRILIMFGAWHKYKILDALEGRKDTSIIDARSLF